MDSHRGIYWAVPTVMVSALLIGIIAAIGHDRFFQYNDRREVGSKLNQKVVSNVGLAFAFLVKVFLVTATSTAFIQQLFYDLKRHGEKVVHVDSLFGALRNILQFRHLKLWLRHGVLLVFAVITWTIPLAVVFTPGTLQVEPTIKASLDVQLQPIRPQQTWINTQNFASSQIDFTALVRCGDNATCAYLINGGPSGSLNAVAVASMATQAILPIVPPELNSSYVLTFYGPALNCSQLDSSTFAAFNTSLTTAYANQNIPDTKSDLGQAATLRGEGQYILKYNAWIGNATNNATNPDWNNETANVSPNQYNANYFYFDLSADSAVQDPSLVQCSMYNATYNTTFSWMPDQVVTIQNVAIAEAVPFNDQVDANNPDYGNLVYNSYLYAFNNIVVGAAINSTVDSTSEAPNAPNVLYFNGFSSMTALQAIIENTLPTKPSTADIIHTIETMFQNMTVSSMSSKALSIPRTEAQSVSGTTTRSVNIYVYTPRDLYIAYGSAILAASLCTTWGLFVMFRLNRAAYSLSFSTVLRTTRRPELDSVVDRKAQHGQEPLPQGLARVKVQLDRSKGFVLAREDEQGGHLLREMKGNAVVTDQGSL